MNKLRSFVIGNVVNWIWMFRCGGFALCGNRAERTFMIGHTELKIIRRNTEVLDSYSREEIYLMLRTVRIAEIKTGWTCPEPEIPCGCIDLLYPVGVHDPTCKVGKAILERMHH